MNNVCRVVRFAARYARAVLVDLLEGDAQRLRAEYERERAIRRAP